MKSDREDKLIDDVAWMRGKLEYFLDQVSPTLATKESVDAVDHRITEHCEGHKDNRNMVPVKPGGRNGANGVASVAIESLVAIAAI